MQVSPSYAGIAVGVDMRLEGAPLAAPSVPQPLAAPGAASTPRRKREREYEDDVKKHQVIIQGAQATIDQWKRERECVIDVKTALLFNSQYTELLAKSMLALQARAMANPLCSTSNAATPAALATAPLATALAAIADVASPVTPEEGEEGEEEEGEEGEEGGEESEVEWGEEGEGEELEEEPYGEEMQEDLQEEEMQDEGATNAADESAINADMEIDGGGEAEDERAINAAGEPANNDAIEIEGTNTIAPAAVDTSILEAEVNKMLAAATAQPAEVGNAVVSSLFAGALGAPLRAFHTEELKKKSAGAVPPDGGENPFNQTNLDSYAVETKYMAKQKFATAPINIDRVGCVLPLVSWTPSYPKSTNSTQ